MTWQVRHEGSPRAVTGLTVQQIADGLRDGLWEPTDEVMGPSDRAWRAIESHPQFAEVIADLEPPLHHRQEPTSLDMTALIDVCLVLLIFFILTTTYAAAVQKVVPLPTAREDTNQKARKTTLKEIRERMIRVQAYLDKAGKPVVHVENQAIPVLADDGETIDVTKVRDALKPYVRGENRKTEVLLDARGITWGMTIAIQDGAKSAGVQTIKLLERKK
jgi:biopolymer transport protein ExbD